MTAEQEGTEQEGAENWHPANTVEKEETPEGSTLATDDAETMVFDQDMQPIGGELGRYNITSEEESDEVSGTRDDLSLAGISLDRSRGKFTINNGFLAYVPNTEKATYCLTAATAENVDKLKAAGYTSGGGIGVISFRPDETIRSDRYNPGDREDYLQAQVALISAVVEAESQRDLVDRIKRGDKIATAHSGSLEEETADYQDKLARVQELRADVKKMAVEKPWDARKEV